MLETSLPHSFVDVPVCEDHLSKAVLFARLEPSVIIVSCGVAIGAFSIPLSFFDCPPKLVSVGEVQGDFSGLILVEDSMVFLSCLIDHSCFPLGSS